MIVPFKANCGCLAKDCCVSLRNRRRAEIDWTDADLLEHLMDLHNPCYSTSHWYGGAVLCLAIGEAARRPAGHIPSRRNRRSPSTIWTLTLRDRRKRRGLVGASVVDGSSTFCG